MKRKRNLIEEILSIRRRSIGVARDIALHHRLQFLDCALNGALAIQDSQARDELIRYVPIGTVTCIEGYFRLTFRDLIDYGPPYSDNAADFNKLAETKLDWGILQAVHGRTVSVGDFLSHSLPLNNLRDIKSNMGTLLKRDFLECLKDIQVFRPNVEKEFYTPIGPLIGDIVKAVDAIFEERHIYCHELALRTKAHYETIQRNYELAKLFLLATEEFMRDLLSEWNDLTSQVEMNARANEEFEKVDRDLKKLIERYSEEEVSDSLTQVQKLWEQFRESYAVYLASSWKGGTGWPLVYHSHMTEITRRRLIELQRDHQSDEDLIELTTLSEAEPS